MLRQTLPAFTLIVLVVGALRAADLHVTPDGKPEASGQAAAPVDLATALTREGLAQPGDTVWVHGGTYEVGVLRQNPKVVGEPGNPITFRAVPGERATVRGGLVVTAAHTWLWGLEVTGSSETGVNVTDADGTPKDGVKLINLVIHGNGAPRAVEPGEPVYPTGQGIGGWDVGNDHEYYGNIVYRNGTNSKDHGIYSQNTAKHSTKRIVDNIIFDNAGYNIHVYGEKPTLSGYHFEGNICYGAGGANILVGGSKPLSNVTLIGNCTYFAPGRGTGRSVDIGYNGKDNRHLRVEGNYFMSGKTALMLKGVAADAVVRGNTFWGEDAPVEVTLAEGAAGSAIHWDRNTYVVSPGPNLSSLPHVKAQASETVIEADQGRPTGVFVFRRLNRYDPDRVHLAVYNWDRRPVVEIDVADLAPVGSRYRVVDAADFYGKAVAEGTVAERTIELPMGGDPEEREFGAFVLFRQPPPSP